MEDIDLYPSSDGGLTRNSPPSVSTVTVAIRSPPPPEPEVGKLEAEVSKPDASVDVALLLDSTCCFSSSTCKRVNSVTSLVSYWLFRRLSVSKLEDGRKHFGLAEEPDVGLWVRLNTQHATNRVTKITTPPAKLATTYNGLLWLEFDLDSRL